MAAKAEATLISDIAAAVLTGGRRTTAANVRTLLADILDSYANIVDGGQIYQAEVGYSTVFNPTQNTSFVTKKWVEDNFVPMGGIGSLSQTLAVGNTTGGYNILLSGSDVVADASATTSFLDLNSQRLYFFDGFNRFAVQADLSSGVIELNARDMVSVTLEHSYVQTLVNGVNIGCYSQSTGNETKLNFGTIYSEISSTYASYTGLTYAADYSSNYTSRSLVDKGYVTGGFVPYTGATTNVDLGVYSLTTPLIIGGSAVGSRITYKSTTGVGTALGDAHVFVGGNNGATSLFSLLNDGTATFYNTINLGASATNGLISWGGTTTILRSGAGFVNMTIGTPAYTTNIVSYNATGNVAIGGVADNATDQLQVSNHIGTPVLNLRGRSGAAPTQLNFVPFDATNSIIAFKTTGGTTRGFIDLNIASGEMKFWGAAGGYFPTFGSNNTEAARINTSQDFGIGTGATISAKLHVIKTSEQLRVGYDTSNYISTTVASTGEITNTLVGTTKTFNISSSGSTVIKVNSSAVITYIGTDGSGGYMGTNSAHAFRVYSANVQRLSFAGSGNGDCTVTDALNFILGSTTGHKFGTATTQKLSFWNATPIVQPSGATQAALAAYATGAFGLDSNANMQAMYDLVMAMRTVLVNTGLMKGAA